jgi:hypothetical protein
MLRHVRIILRARRFARLREYRRLCDPNWLAAIRPPASDHPRRLTDDEAVDLIREHFRTDGQ